ncbi:MAG: phage tail protein, partial [Gammaproteobacteria bacterium]
MDFYAIGRHVSGRAAIEPLMQSYFFDAVESGSALKFVNRGGSSVATFTENDLGFADGSSALVKTTRQQEHELPIQINIGHLDINNDYQPGSQQFRRLTTPSKHVVDLELPLAFSSSKAAQIAEVLMLNAWTERERFEMQATRKHAALEPTDIITLPNGQLARIVVSEYSDTGSLRLEAVADAVAHYSPVAVGNDASANTPQEVPLGGPTNLLILDIPALEDKDNRAGYYLAAGGYYAGWGGCEILVSTDAGVSYSSVFAITDDAEIGATTTALGDWPYPQQMDVINSVTVQMNDTANTLAGITDAQVLEGGNLCAIRAGSGWEILQFGVATLVSAGKYTLSRLMRGRFGGEALTAGHFVGDTFLVITREEINFLARPQADVGLDRLVKAATFGETSEAAEPMTITLIGNSQLPLAPLHLTAATDRATNDWSLSWKRRARTYFWWLDITEIPL